MSGANPTTTPEGIQSEAVQQQITNYNKIRKVLFSRKAIWTSKMSVRTVPPEVIDLTNSDQEEEEEEATAARTRRFTRRSRRRLNNNNYICPDNEVITISSSDEEGENPDSALPTSLLFPGVPGFPPPFEPLMPFSNPFIPPSAPNNGFANVFMTPQMETPALRRRTRGRNNMASENGSNHSSSTYNVRRRRRGIDRSERGRHDDDDELVGLSYPALRREGGRREFIRNMSSANTSARENNLRMLMLAVSNNINGGVRHDNQAAVFNLIRQLGLERATTGSSVSGQKRASRAAINKLPLETLGQEAAEQEKECCICLEQLAPGNLVRSLPCKHKFHKTCIDSWLKVNKVCPLDKLSI